MGRNRVIWRGAWSVERGCGWGIFLGKRHRIELDRLLCHIQRHIQQALELSMQRRSGAWHSAGTLQGQKRPGISPGISMGWDFFSQIGSLISGLRTRWDGRLSAGRYTPNPVVGVNPIPKVGYVKKSIYMARFLELIRAN